LTGTLINVGTVLAGGAIGSVVGSRFPERTRATLLQAIGLVTVVIGLQRALPGENVLLLLISVVIGAVLGEVLDIDARLEQLGRVAERLLNSRERKLAPSQTAIETESAGTVAARSGLTARGFVTASLIFCVGPMTIMGSFEDGLFGAYQTLALKATLDGITATILAATLGWGVLLAAATVLIFQGTLTLGASLLRTTLTEPMIAQITAVGGLLLLGVGLNILELTRIRVANLLPALAVAPALVALSSGRQGM
jgi:hypothetical protein